jgi:hypothetical protein
MAKIDLEMEIKIKTSEELNKLLDALAKEIVFAHIYYCLLCDLSKARTTHEREFSNFNTFWTLTLGALRTAYQTHLCRVYDQESASLNLVNLLHTIQSNLHLFSESYFRERLSGNAFVDSLAKTKRMPEKDELESDMELVTCENPIVKKLIVWRNNIVAHRGAKVALGKDQVLSDNPISDVEIKELLEQSLSIFNKYSSFYNASTQSSGIIGHDDYKHLLKFIGLGLKKWDEDIEKQYATLGVQIKKTDKA